MHGCYFLKSTLFFHVIASIKNILLYACSFNCIGNHTILVVHVSSLVNNNTMYNVLCVIHARRTIKIYNVLADVSGTALCKFMLLYCGIIIIDTCMIDLV